MAPAAASANHWCARRPIAARERPGWLNFYGKDQLMAQARWQWLRFIGNGQPAGITPRLTDAELVTCEPTISSSNDHDLSFRHH